MKSTGGFSMLSNGDLICSAALFASSGSIPVCVFPLSILALVSAKFWSFGARESNKLALVPSLLEPSNPELENWALSFPGPVLEFKFKPVPAPGLTSRLPCSVDCSAIWNKLFPGVPVSAGTVMESALAKILTVGGFDSLLFVGNKLELGVEFPVVVPNKFDVTMLTPVPGAMSSLCAGCGLI